MGEVSVCMVVFNQKAQIRRALLVQSQLIDLALGWASMHANIQSNQVAASA